MHLATAIILIVTGVSNILLGILVYLKVTDKPLGRSFFALTVCLAYWTFALAWGHFLTGLDQALWATRLLMIGTIPIPFFFHQFVRAVRKEPASLPLRWKMLHGIFIVSLWAGVPNALLIQSAEAQPWGIRVHLGPLYGLFAFYLIGGLGFGMSLLLNRYRQATAFKKQRIQYFMLAALTAMIFGITGNIILPILKITQFAGGGPLGSLFMCMIVAYAIVKHQLMDIKVVIRRTIIYSLLTAILATMMVFLGMLSTTLTQNVLGHGTIWSSALAACMITVFFHPLQLKVQAFVDRHLFRGWKDQPMLREVAAGFSHELKSPLAGLSWQAQLILSELRQVEDGKCTLNDVLPKIKKDLGFLESLARDAAGRIEAVRGLADPGKTEMDPISIPVVLEHSLANVDRLISRSLVTVQRDWPSTVPTIYGNAKQLEIVFTNLMKNAVEAMSELRVGAKRELSIQVYEQESAVVISIKDTGPGIGQNQLLHLFKPFFTTKGSQGTGMGLYLSYQIIQGHEGRIEVLSEKGKGTEFIVRLPETAHGRNRLKAA